MAHETEFDRPVLGQLDQEHRHLFQGNDGLAHFTNAKDQTPPTQVYLGRRLAD